jgi:exodeoxyribonuclease VII large subunit
VVTSPTGAAIRDILNVMSRRFPNLHVLLAPVRVQGEGAAEEIAAAIELLNRRGGLDVLIVGRGGGSLEDLWSFNEEVVARAIAASRIPVISAVGHEIDFTISDFVADLRAPTPSAAAELVVGRKQDFEDRLSELSRRVSRSIQDCLVTARHRLRAAAGSYVFREPAHMVKQLYQRLDGLEMRAAHGMQGRLREGRQRLGDWRLRALHALRMKHQASLQEVKRLDTHLNALNPMAVLGRGYSITSDRHGRVIRSAGSVRPGQRLTTRVRQGAFESEVVGTLALGGTKGGRGDDGEKG